MPTIPADRLRTITHDLLVKVGAPPANAACVADHLVRANLLGHDSHGVGMIPMYLEAIRRGQLRPAAAPDVVRDDGDVALVGGGWTFGQVGAELATRVAVAKAKRHGIALVAAVRCHHVGRLGHYCELAAAESVGTFIALGGFRTGFSLVPPGGAERALAANPLAFGFPAGDRPPVIVDFATTAVAVGKVRVARDEGKPLPPGLIVDRVGNPSTDPNDFFEGGALLPFGGHKGYALALAVDLLGGALVGGEEYMEPGEGQPEFDASGTLIFAFDVGVFRSAAAYRRAAERIVARVKGVQPAPDADGVVVPGEPELATRARRAAEGIPIPETTWSQIRQAAAACGVEMPAG